MKYPLVRSHPRTGRRALYFGSKVTIGIEGWPEDRARAYLAALEAKATAPVQRYAHKWAVGDAVLWDNRRVLHAGTPFDNARYRRCMHRTTWREDQPVH
jgi:alpha-ketoglutarate-dependent taurine dioxygenase